MRMRESKLRIDLLLAVVVGFNALFWFASKSVYTHWQGVPPVPSRPGAVTMALGDPEFSYRFFAIILQNMGDMGHDTTPLKSYDYGRLGQWFSLLNQLDPVSNHVPMIAAYYFGGTKVPKDVGIVVNYLRTVGQLPLTEKWRWLAHAAYLARHRMYDLPLALELAYQLQRLPNSGDMPSWARNMPAFVLTESSDKEASRKMMENIILTDRHIGADELGYLESYMVHGLGVSLDELKALLQRRAEAMARP